MEVRAVVDAQFFVLRGGKHEGFSVAAQMHGVTAPVADGVDRHGDLVPARAGGAPVFGIEIVAHVIPHQIILKCIQ